MAGMTPQQWCVRTPGPIFPGREETRIEERFPMSHIPYYGEDLAPPPPRRESPAAQPQPQPWPRPVQKRDLKAIEDEFFSYY